MSQTIKQATIQDIEQIAPLFDAYRQFYGKTSDIALAHSFLFDRLNNKESIIFFAINNTNTALGFTQLYPSFSSTRAARTYILNDLYVAPEMRRTGIATALLEETARFARSSGAARMSLSTALTNISAQKLYESLGWKRDEAFCEYGLLL
jgi:ribosomal protein S18 acetylase RimI-like enzyme